MSIDLHEKRNGTLIASGTDILITPLFCPTNLKSGMTGRLFISLDTETKIEAHITDSDSNTEAMTLNSNDTLKAGALYCFDVYLAPGDSLQFQHDESTAVTISYKLVQISGEGGSIAAPQGQFAQNIVIASNVTVKLEYANDTVSVYGSEGVPILTDVAGKTLITASNTDTILNSIDSFLSSVDAKIDLLATEITLSGVDTTLTSLNAKFNSFGQKSMASSTPIVIASDQSAIPAFTEAKATATGTDSYSIASGTNSVVAVKASAGNLYDLDFINPSSNTDAFVQLFDSASPTLGTTQPKRIILVPSGATGGLHGQADKHYDPPLSFSNSIKFAVTNTPTGSGAPAEVLIANFGFK